MSYLVFDTETTGLVDWAAPSDAPHQPRLASWCMIFADDNLEIEHSWSALVRPDGWEMPPEAMMVNGLSNIRLAAEGQDIRWPLSLMIAGLQGGRIPVAHNFDFDAKIMRGELRRSPFGGYAALIPSATGICTMRGLTGECAIPHPKFAGRYKWPSLAQACDIILGINLIDAHDCEVDAMACLRLLRAMRERDLLRAA